MRNGIPRLIYKNTPPAVCRLCEQPIVKDDGTPNTRRRWHPECADRYMFHTSNAAVRHAVFARDRGVCAVCGVDGSVRVRTPIANAYRRVAVRSGWDADHIVPLAEGGAHELANLQTLCLEHHKAKTREQAARRRKARS